MIFEANNSLVDETVCVTTPDIEQEKEAPILENEQDEQNCSQDPKSLLNWPKTPERLGVRNTKRRNFVITSDQWVQEEKDKIEGQEKERQEIELRKQKRQAAKKEKEALKQLKLEQKSQNSKKKKVKNTVNLKS